MLTMLEKKDINKDFPWWENSKQYNFILIYNIGSTYKYIDSNKKHTLIMKHQR